jgi:hypothetical protein
MAALATAATVAALLSRSPVAQVATASQDVQAPLDDVLERAGAYVTSYERDFAGVVAEESYVQDASSGNRFDTSGHLARVGVKHRELKSDLLLVRPDGSDRWLQFRDVYEVDGRAVRDRSDRLARLFLQPSSSTSKQVSKIMDESARYNIGTIVRNVNVPMLALWVLMPENQYRFVYNHVEAPDASTAGAWKVAYREMASGTMIRGVAHQDIPVEGFFWIEPSSGRVLRSHLVAQNRTVRAWIDVTYAMDAKLGLLAPEQMTESYGQTADSATVDGQATYSNFRRFQVKVDEKIAPIK